MGLDTYFCLPDPVYPIDDIDNIGIIPVNAM